MAVKRRSKRKKTVKHKAKRHHKRVPKAEKVKRAKAKVAAKKSVALNKKTHWAAYETLQKKVDLAWAKLRKSAKKKTNPHILIRDKNHLLLLLGECNYMARECMRYHAAARKKRRKR